jgi:hypothetical protein
MPLTPKTSQTHKEKRMSKGYEPKSVMGWVFGVGAGILSMPVAAAKGAYDAVNGGDFVDGAVVPFGYAIEVGAEFGDKHGGKIVSRVITGLLLGVGVDIAHGFHDHDV